MPPSRLAFLAKTTAFVLSRPRLRRKTVNVTEEYSAGWEAYRGYLERAATLAEWLRIPEVEDKTSFFNVQGQLSFGNFDSGSFYRNTLLKAINHAFPEAQSVTEYGSGVGRNLLFLKQHRPDLSAYGYELCQPGVEAGNAAAGKFGMDVRYAQLDYLGDPEEKYVHPVTDVAFTMFSLEQLPTGCETALSHMLEHVRLGTIHIEPVPENYPWSFRGVLGKIDHWKVGYLSGFDKAVKSLDLERVEVIPAESAHNPLMFPSVYILRKKQS